MEVGVGWGRRRVTRQAEDLASLKSARGSLGGGAGRPGPAPYPDRTQFNALRTKNGQISPEATMSKASYQNKKNEFAGFGGWADMLISVESPHNSHMRRIGGIFFSRPSRHFSPSACHGRENQSMDESFADLCGSSSTYLLLYSKNKKQTWNGKQYLSLLQQQSHQLVQVVR